MIKKGFLKKGDRDFSREFFFVRFFFSFFVFLYPIFGQTYISSSSSIPLSKKWGEKREKILFSYFSEEQNQNPIKKESVTLLLEDIRTKSLVQMTLEETNENSSLFQSLYFLEWEGEKFSWNFYIFTSKGERKSDSSFISRSRKNKDTSLLQTRPKGTGRNVLSLIRRILQGKEKPLYVLRIPFVKEKKSFFQKVEIYDVKEKMEERLKRIPAGSSLRSHFYLEDQRYQLKRQERSLMSEKERRENEKKAQTLRDEAIKKYKEGHFKEAEHLFKDSLFSHPEKRRSHFNYGMSLYRNKKFKKAFVELSLAKREVEKNSKEEIGITYYQALINYQLGNKEESLRLFKKISFLNNKDFSPISSFYQGLIFYHERKFQEALISFRRSLQIAEDSHLRVQSQRYIDKTLHILSFQKKRAKAFTLKGVFGVLFDSHILSISSSPKTNEVEQSLYQEKSGGGRSFLLGDFSYCFFKGKKSDMGLDVNSQYLYSFRDEHSYQDPFSFSLHFPFSWKMPSRNKKEIDKTRASMTSFKYKLDLSPGFEVFYMDLNKTGVREKIFNSYGAKTRLFIFHQKRWQSFYSFDVFMQDEKKEESNKIDGLRTSFQTQHVLSSKKSLHQFFLIGMKGTSYMARHSLRKYYKLKFQTGYQRPFVLQKAFSWNIQLTTYYLLFPRWETVEINEEAGFSSGRSFQKREDIHISLSVGLKIPLKSWISFVGRVGVSKNRSSLSYYSYQNYSTLVYVSMDF